MNGHNLLQLNQCNSASFDRRLRSGKHTIRSLGYLLQTFLQVGNNTRIVLHTQKQ